MRLTISGTVSPDCTTPDTGEPAGQYNGQDYWTWEAGGQAWALFASEVSGKSGEVIQWAIQQTAPGVLVEPYWISSVPEGGAATGTYSPVPLVSGNLVTVTEYTPPEPPADEYLVVEWTASGRFTVLKKGA
jgi:hypothetical protein